MNEKVLAHCGLSRQIKKGGGDKTGVNKDGSQCGVAVFTSNGHCYKFAHGKFCKTGIISILLKVLSLNSKFLWEI